MRILKIGVPPGVGDIYWALCKLESIRSKYSDPIEVELVILSSQYDRSGAWAQMCPFVDRTSFRRFNSAFAERHGIATGAQADGLDMILWPNAALDRGEHLQTWLPQFELNQAWRIETRCPEVVGSLALQGELVDDPTDAVSGHFEPTGRLQHPVVYVSSEAINKSWAPQLGAPYWNALFDKLRERFDAMPILIGAAWDGSYRDRLRARCYDLTGRTTLPEVAWLLEHAAGVVGIISGMTILANHFRTPTIAFYPPKHHHYFPYTWTTPEHPYTAINTGNVPSPWTIAETLHDMTLSPLERTS